MPASGKPSFFRQAARVAWKDLRVELRTKEILYTMVFFGLLIAIVFAFTFPENAALAPLAAPGMLWVAVTFAGTIGLGRAFDRERENDTLRALMLSPVPRLAIFLGKAAAMTALVLAVATVVSVLIALFMNVPLFDEPLILLVVVLLGAIGFSLVGTVFAATLLKVRARDVLLPVMLYPVLIPMLDRAATVTAAILKPPVPDYATAWSGIAFLTVYDAAFLVLSLWLFESLVIE
jgi:heme exporter protein CcmB